MNGLYKAQFQTPFGSGSAVFVLRDGQLRGGNGALYYVGNYRLDGETFSATLKTDRHTHDLTTASVFGMDRLNVTLEGVVNGNTITFDGVADEVPDMQVQGMLERLCD
ncbi:hypothetical protein [Sneathiella sp.]|jgi:hypothetical protein|uniref:hypothetical protein n=1 Tax=Sneathiella sp. TaxID=1964365 RepID=UPI0039E45393